MADRKWVGGTSTAFGTAANWLDAADAAGVPADGDSIYFHDFAQFACTTGTESQGAKNFPLISVGPDYTGDIGTSANHLTCGADVVRMNGPGTFYLKCDDGAGAPGTDWVDKIFVYDGTLYIDAAGVTDAADEVQLVRIFRGRVFIETLGNYDTIEVLSSGGLLDAILDIAAGVDERSAAPDDQNILTLRQESGKVICRSDIDALDVSGGEFEFQGDMTCDTSLIARGNALVKLNSSLHDALPSVEIYDNAKVTAENNEHMGAPTLTAVAGYGGVLNLQTKKGTVTATTVNYHSGDFITRLDANKKITIANQ